MNLYRKLADLFKEKVEVPEVKERVRVDLKKERVVAEVWYKGGWASVKKVDIGYVSFETAVVRARLALKNYEALGADEEGVIK